MVIAEREEGNQYLLPAAVEPEYPRRSEIHTACGWKGTASHYDVGADGHVDRDAAWYRPTSNPPRQTSRATSRSGGA